MSSSEFPTELGREIRDFCRPPLFSDVVLFSFVFLQSLTGRFGRFDREIPPGDLGDSTGSFGPEIREIRQGDSDGRFVRFDWEIRTGDSGGRFGRFHREIRMGDSRESTGRFEREIREIRRPTLFRENCPLKGATRG